MRKWSFFSKTVPVFTKTVSVEGDYQAIGALYGLLFDHLITPPLDGKKPFTGIPGFMEPPPGRYPVHPGFFRVQPGVQRTWYQALLPAVLQGFFHQHKVP
jgi:hypothetical protein